jgi:hypothetical protein
MAPAVQRQEPPYLQLLAAEQIIEGTAGYIRQVTGHEAVRGTDQDSARAAAQQDAEDLGVPVGSTHDYSFT